MVGAFVTGREVTPVKPGTAMEEQLQLKGIGRLLAGFGYRYGSEVQLHQALSTVLDQAGHAHVREYRLDASSRADFIMRLMNPCRTASGTGPCRCFISSPSSSTACPACSKKLLPPLAVRCV